MYEVDPTLRASPHQSVSHFHVTVPLALADPIVWGDVGDFHCFVGQTQMSEVDFKGSIIFTFGVNLC